MRVRKRRRKGRPRPRRLRATPGGDRARGDTRPPSRTRRSHSRLGVLEVDDEALWSRRSGRGTDVSVAALLAQLLGRSCASSPRRVLGRRAALAGGGALAWVGFVDGSSVRSPTPGRTTARARPLPCTSATTTARPRVFSATIPTRPGRDRSRSHIGLQPRADRAGSQALEHAVRGVAVLEVAVALAEPRVAVGVARSRPRRGRAGRRSARRSSRPAARAPRSSRSK